LRQWSSYVLDVVDNGDRGGPVKGYHLITVTGGGQDEPGQVLLALLGVFNPRATCFSSSTLCPSIPAAALSMTRWMTCLLLIAPSLSPAANMMGAKLASTSDFEREHR
jgi:hypothetical protein